MITHNPARAGKTCPQCGDLMLAEDDQDGEFVYCPSCRPRLVGHQFFNDVSRKFLRVYRGRRWFRFSLRTLMVLMAVAGGCFWWQTHYSFYVVGDLTSADVAQIVQLRGNSSAQQFRDHQGWTTYPIRTIRSISEVQAGRTLGDSQQYEKYAEVVTGEGWRYEKRKIVRKHSGRWIEYYGEW